MAKKIHGLSNNVIHYFAKFTNPEKTTSMIILIRKQIKVRSAPGNKLICQVKMKVLLFTTSIILFSRSSAAPVSVTDPLQRIQQEVEQLKLNYDRKIASLEQQLKLERNLPSKSGKNLVSKLM